MNNKSNLKRLYRYCKPYKKRFLIGLISLSMVGSIMPALITMIKPVMDNIFVAQADIIIPFINITIPQENAINYIALIVVVLAFFMGIFHYLGKYYMAYVGQHVAMDLRNRLFRHLVYQSLGFYSRYPTGQLLSRITNDVKYLESSIVKIPMKLIRDGLQLIVILILVFVFNWRWALMAVAGFVFIILPFVKFSQVLRSLGKKGHQKMADIYDFLAEKVSGVRLVKVFSMEKQEQRNMRKVNRKFIDLVLKSERINAFQKPFIEFLSVLGIALGIVVIGNAVVEGTTTPGEFFLFIAYLVGIYTPAKNFAGLNQKLQRAIAASDRIFEVLDMREHIVQVENPVILKSFKDKIEFKDVGFAYQADDYVLKNISFNIKRGQIAAFVGPSGAGKSTLVNLVPRFFDPQRGSIEIDGINLKNYTVRSIRQKTAMVMQDVILFNTTIKENICYGLGDFSHEEVEKYAKAAHAHDFIMECPEGYDTVVGEKGVKLSGGQKQRISIARALIKDPEILILDEATSHLDTESEKLVQDALDYLMSERTTLVIAHRLSTIRKADKIIVLKDGEMQEQGRHEELLEVDGVYRRMFEMQSL